MTNGRFRVQLISGGQPGFTQFVLLFLISTLSLLAWKPASANSAVDDTIKICGAEWPDHEAWIHALASIGWSELPLAQAKEWVPSVIIGFPGFQIEDLLENGARLLHSFTKSELKGVYSEHLSVQGPTWWSYLELNEVALRSSTQKGSNKHNRLATCTIVSRNAEIFDNVVAQPDQPTSASKDAYATSHIFQWKLSGDRTVAITKRTFLTPDDLSPSLVGIWPAAAIHTVTFWNNQ